MNKKQKKTLQRIIISVVLLAAAWLATAAIEYFLGIEGIIRRLVFTVIYLIPYLTVGLGVLKKSLRNIKNGQIFDENFLMSLATIGAFCLGEYMEAAAVMIFYQIGQLFENIAVNKSRQAITSLVSLRPDYANVEKDGKLEQVDPYDVAIGDIVTVLPGEKVPLDGIVAEGESYINTAALTGESVPRHIKSGESILSGCINEQGVLRVSVTKEFDDSTVAKILDMVENAGSRKSRSESFITRFAKYYTPLVVLAAVTVAFLPPIILKQSFAKWVSRALIFLVISCPCALVISVPLGFFGGIGAASKLGILVKGSNYLEAAAYADTVVFDKTGTLTEGIFRVNTIASVCGLPEDVISTIAAYAESYSNHPIATSIQRSYEEGGGSVDKERIEAVNELAGKGISLLLKNVEGLGDDFAKLSARRYYVGNARLMQDKAITVPDMSDILGSVVYVSDEEHCLGYIVISDAIKKDTREAVSELYKNGVGDTVMLTGDRRQAASAIAGEIGIRTVYSELLPGDKLSKLEELIEARSKKGRSGVIYVGDGINDAPALIRADVGIAMGAMGQDAAIEAADIVLMDDNPKKIVTVKHIGRKTLKIVYENIVFALGIKLLAMVLGVLGIANMWFAVFADVGVSVIAILNSMRMLGYRE